MDPVIEPVAPRAGARLAHEPPLSWAAILAGAVTAVAVSTVLTVLAAGFGLRLSFPGLASRGSLGDFTPELGAYAVAVQVVSAGLGGYLAGRLRHAWSSAHGDEAHFRDTAHGLVTWAVATLAGVVLAAGVLGPYADQLSAGVAATAATGQRAADIAAQSAFFIAVGMLLSAFTAAVAARIGGYRTEEMHAKGLA